MADNVHIGCQVHTKRYNIYIIIHTYQWVALPAVPSKEFSGGKFMVAPA
jgi:hypothetical protein